MKDRVSLYPGRVKLTPVSGQENTYGMVRADEPTQEGTPLNKATLLKDATAALFGLDENAVPDDAFVKIAGQFSESLQIVLLWENASPQSAFNPQTITLDLSQYTHVFITFNVDNTHYIDASYLREVKDSATVQEVSFADAKLLYRNFYVTKTGVQFFGGAYASYNSSGSFNHNYLIPWKIYGVKGVQSA